eukprot:15326529-Ditylum_brightwellii.AAC.1
MLCAEYLEWISNFSLEHCNVTLDEEVGKGFRRLPLANGACVKSSMLVAVVVARCLRHCLLLSLSTSVALPTLPFLPLHKFNQEEIETDSQ